MKSNSSKLKFKAMIETRYADPVMALDISSHQVGFGTAMGRIAFYNIENGKETVISDTQPELVRGVSIFILISSSFLN